MSTRRRQKKFILVGIILVSAIGALSFLSLSSNAVYFYTPDEALAQAPGLQKSVIRVGGMVKGGSVDWDRGTLKLNFTLSDLKQSEIAVHHTGTPPDMFKENSGVVVEGHITGDGKEFRASKLMVKHSEEYRKPDGTHSMDRALLEKSIFKEETF